MLADEKTELERKVTLLRNDEGDTKDRDPPIIRKPVSQ